MEHIVIAIVVIGGVCLVAGIYIASQIEQHIYRGQNDSLLDNMDKFNDRDRTDEILHNAVVGDGREDIDEDHALDQVLNNMVDDEAYEEYLDDEEERIQTAKDHKNGLYGSDDR